MLALENEYDPEEGFIGRVRYGHFDQSQLTRLINLLATCPSIDIESPESHGPESRAVNVSPNPCRVGLCMMNRPQPRSTSSDEEDGITLWLRDSLSQAESALASAGEMGWSESQTQELQREVDFFAALARRSPNPPRPPEWVLEHVRQMLAMAEQRVEESRPTTMPSPRQKAVRDAYVDSLQRVRRTIDQFD